MTIHKALYPRGDIDRPYVEEKEGKRGLAIFEDCVDASMWELKDYIKKRKERLIIVASGYTDNITGSHQ